MWEYLFGMGLSLAVVYLIRTWLGVGQPDFWTVHGFPKITNTISTLDLLTGRKSNMDGDLEHYASLGEQGFGGLTEFGAPLLLIKDLDLTRDIFIKDFDHFFDRRDVPLSDTLFSRALFFMKGQNWKDMRAFLSPTLTSGRIKRMFPHFGRSSKNLENYITSLPISNPEQGFSIPVTETVRKYTLDVISATAFGLESDVFSNPESTFFKMAAKLADFSLGRKLRFVLFLGFPKIANFFNISTTDKGVSAYFVEMLRGVLRSREATAGDKNQSQVRDDFLQLIVEARKGALKIEESELSREEKEAQFRPRDGANKSNVVWNEDTAISQSFVFLVAGLDSIARALGVALHQLTAHPEMQEKVYKEIDEICGSRENISYEDLNAMEYLDNFISESLRLYPVAGRIERKCMMDYPIPGSNLVIPKGTILAFPIDGIHRDEKHWPNPTKFDPDRFTAGNRASRHNCAYMPFGVGPRNCIGMRFALVETKLALANIVKNFRLVPADIPFNPVRDLFGYTIPPTAKLSFIPRN